MAILGTRDGVCGQFTPFPSPHELAGGAPDLCGSLHAGHESCARLAPITLLAVVQVAGAGPGT